MSARTAEPQDWRRGRWLAIISIIAVSQLALIYWLAGHGAAPQPPVEHSVMPRIVVTADAAADIVGANDPTIFTHANPRGFSGPAWMQAVKPADQQPAWVDPSPPSNELRIQQPGNSLTQYLETNPVAAVELSPGARPQHPSSSPVTIDTNSMLTIAGALHNRPLLQPLKLDSWPGTDATEMLSNSVVQAGVDAEGNVFSAVLLTSCGSKDADASALALAESARFQPLDRNSAVATEKQTWGQMTFHWHTVPAPQVNTAPGGP